MAIVYRYVCTLYLQLNNNFFFHSFPERCSKQYRREGNKNRNELASKMISEERIRREIQNVNRKIEFLSLK